MGIWDDIVAALKILLVSALAAFLLAVGYIQATQEAPSPVFRVRTTTSIGTAFGVRYMGHTFAITAAHVCQSAFTGFLLDDKGVKHTVMYRSDHIDVCLIENDGPTYDLRTVTTQLGRPAVAYGFPFGVGMVESVGFLRTLVVAGGDVNILFTNSVNPGNSGGPLLQNDNVVGVVVAVSTEGERLGYAVPIQIILPIIVDYYAGVKVD